MQHYSNFGETATEHIIWVCQGAEPQGREVLSVQRRLEDRQLYTLGMDKTNGLART